VKRTPLDRVRARRKSPEYDPLLRAICDACGIVRAEHTLDERRDFNRHVSSLIEQGATPERVKKRAATFHWHFPSIPLTLENLDQLWSKLGHPTHR
jgi:hypothetical protein